MKSKDTRPPGEPRITILHVPHCALVGRLRADVETALQALGSMARIDLVEGRFSSPTLLIDGVALERFHPGDEAACRVDLPTREEIASAIAAAVPGRSLRGVEGEDQE